MYRQKKGSLSLSMNAIVIVVLAFVMLGLGLTMTNMIFTGANQPLQDALGSLDLNAEPTPSNPLTISDNLVLSKRSPFTQKIGFFNRDNQVVEGGQIQFEKCISAEDGSDVNVPAVNSLGSSTIGASQSGEFVVSIEPSSDDDGDDGGMLTGNNYICTIQLVDEDENEVFSKTLSIQVTN